MNGRHVDSYQCCLLASQLFSLENGAVFAYRISSYPCLENSHSFAPGRRYSIKVSRKHEDSSTSALEDARVFVGTLVQLIRTAHLYCTALDVRHWISCFN